MKARDLASATYVGQLREMHSKGLWDGGGGCQYRLEIMHLIRKLQAQTVLDYGCGGSSLKTCIKPNKAKVLEYDPGVLGKDHLPDPADLVVLTDVLEHVEPDKLNAVLDHVYGLTLKGAFMVIATRPASKRLPDDRNAHLIIDNAEWWNQKLRTLDWLVSVREYDLSQVKFWTRKKA